MVGKGEQCAVMDDFFAFLVRDVVVICLPHSCRGNSPGLESPDRIDTYDDELPQYSLK